MTQDIFETLKNPNANWICLQCGLPNFSDSFFDSSLSETPNPFEILSPNRHPPTSSQSPQTQKSPLRTKNPNQNSNKADDSSQHPPHLRRRPRNKPICSLVINFRSLNDKKVTFRNHVSKLEETEGLDVIFGCETWLTEKHLNSELFLDEYDIYRRDRQNRVGGGVILCIKKSLSSTLVHVGKEAECIFAKINVPGKPPILLGCAYQSMKENERE